VLGRDYAGQRCSVARALEVVGERWTLLIVRDALLGVSRFSEFQRSLGIARNVLADRLESLVQAGVLERRQDHASGHPDYLLTPRGRALEPVILQLMHWGDELHAAPSGPPRIAAHAGCGGRVDHELECRRCGARVRYRDIEVRPGSAVNERGRAGARVMRPSGSGPRGRPPGRS
jgi:DNA-binding HxlR family transcriptional regulator